jgi:hypothetical protein
MQEKMATENTKPIIVFLTGSVEALSPNGDNRRFTVYTPEQGTEKCQGVGCAFKQSCGRFIRAEMPEQKWAAYYALPDDDCQYFEAISQGEKNAKA